MQTTIEKLREVEEIINKTAEDSDGDWCNNELQPAIKLIREIIEVENGLHEIIESQKQTFNALIKKYKKAVGNISEVTK